MRADLVRPADDRLHVLDLTGLEQDVRDRHEQRTLVDRVDDRLVVLDDDDVELRLRLVEVAHAREVAFLVDDAISVRVDRAEAGQHDRLGNGDVLVHDRRAWRCADDASDLVADGHRHLPPTLAPGPNPTFAPHARELEHAVLGGGGHSAERVIDQIRRVAEDRKPLAVVRQLHSRTLLTSKRGSPPWRATSLRLVESYFVTSVGNEVATLSSPAASRAF